jgi:hypothetical protein
MDVTRNDATLIHMRRVVNAHVMGGCTMAGIGANPQRSIYGIVHKLASGLPKRLSGRDVKLAPAA